MSKSNHIKFYNSTIFMISVAIIVLVLPINIMSVIFSTMVLRQSEAEISKEIQTSLDMSVQNLESSLNSAARQMTYMNINNVEFTVVASDKSNNTDFFENFRKVRDDLENLQLSSDLVDLLYYIFPVTGYTLISGYPGINTPDYREVIDAVPERERKAGTHWEFCEIDGTSVLLGYASWRNAYYGVMLNLERTLNKLNLISYEEGRIVFFVNETYDMFTRAGRQYMEEQEMAYTDILNSDRYLMYQSEVEDCGLILVEIVDRNLQLSKLPMAVRVMQVLAIVTAILAVPMLLYYMSRLVNRPLNRLIYAINRIEQGDLDYRIEERDKGREFERINHSFNDMMDQVSELKIDVYEQELEKKDIKMQYLSQQIQPHFILNAMNLLYSYEPEEFPLIQKMILCISKYFRYVVKMNAEFVELHQELDHIKNYFEIQKARFPGLFYSIVECEDDLKDALIPPLLIQNFAENAIKHSLKIGNKITIFITADHCGEEGKEDYMRIRLADTGEGIPDELLEKIESFQQTGEHQEGLGVGIQNSIERLKNLYADMSTIRISRDEFYGGTNVEMILPVYYDLPEEES